MITTANQSMLIIQRAAAARDAQRVWAATPVRQRLRLIRRVRAAIANHADKLASAATIDRPDEALVAQVLPLADACRFLEKHAAAILRSRRLGKNGRPLWLHGIESWISREALGLVLIIAASNYPLFLPGVQLIQALIAGNAVLLKPGRNGARAAGALAELCNEAGLDPRLFVVLPESDAAGSEALDLPVDKVFFTGSFETGQQLLARLAARAIPAVVELSGCDAVFVREDADVELVVRALRFGLTFNNSKTCIAPRRVFVSRRIAEKLEAHLADAVRSAPASFEYLDLIEVFREATAGGAMTLVGGVDARGALHLPCILTDARTCMRIMRIDTFAPVLCVVPTDSDEQALSLAAECPFALGASIFSRSESAALELASRVRTGLVTINDVIVPSADPRVPFGGRARSGFGVTRGAAGLLEMTTPKVVQLRRGNFRPHLRPEIDTSRNLFQNYIAAMHSRGLLRRIGAGLKTLVAIRNVKLKKGHVR
jgi:acyl-CoA reductase-like NAD-dependent aldehyde dehydrogenase